jgi:hypothetical protein
LAVEPPFAARVGALLPRRAGGDVAGPARRLEPAPDRPGVRFRAAAPADLGCAGAAQAAPGAEQADRLQQVGLADAVLAGDGDDAPGEACFEGGVGAELGEPQPDEAQRGRGRGQVSASRPIRVTPGTISRSSR